MPKRYQRSEIDQRLVHLATQHPHRGLYTPTLRLRTLAAIDDRRRHQELPLLVVAIVPALVTVGTAYTLLPAYFVAIALRWLGAGPLLAEGLGFVLSHGTGAALAGLLTIPLLRPHLLASNQQGVDRP